MSIAVRYFLPTLVSVLIGNHLLLDSKSVAAEDAAVSKEIVDLVNSLENSNAPPFIDNHREAHFGSDYRWGEQVRVMKSWKTLNDKFDEAIPTLVKNADNKAYCCTIISESGASHNKTVGHVCVYIIELNISPYTRPWFGRAGFPNFLESFDAEERPRIEIAIKNWWREREQRNCNQLQLESVDWAVKHLKSHSEVDMSATEKEQFEENISELTKMRQELVRDGAIRIKPKWQDKEEVKFPVAR